VVESTVLIFLLFLLCAWFAFSARWEGCFFQRPVNPRNPQPRCYKHRNKLTAVISMKHYVTWTSWLLNNLSPPVSTIYEARSSTTRAR